MKLTSILFITICEIMFLAPLVDAHLIYSTDFNYLGAFTLPPDVSGAAMTYNPEGDQLGSNDSYPGSLFSNEKSTSNGLVTEFTIPAPVISISKNVKDLPVAEILQGPTDITGNRVDGKYTGCSMTGLQYLPKQGEQENGKLYWSRMTFYVEHCKTLFGWANPNLSKPDSAGMWKLDIRNEAVYNHYLFEIPKHWSDKYLEGRYLAAGRYREGGGNSGGPSLFAFAPWKYGNPPEDETLMGSVPLLYYEISDHKYLGMMKHLSNNDQWLDGAWLEVGDKSAVMLSGRKSTRTKESGTGHYGVPLPDGCGSKGYHSEPGHSALLFYDPDDFVDVVQGKKKYFEPQPYLLMQLDNYLFKHGFCLGESLGGIGYDRKNNLLYIAEPRAKIIHVFRVNDSGQGPDTTTPTKPSNVVVNRFTTEINLKWDASTDDSGKVIYVVYRMGRPIGLFDPGPKKRNLTYGDDDYAPIAVTRDKSFIDKKFKYFRPPYRYKIEARDVANNANGAEVAVDATYLEIDSSSFIDDGSGLIRHKIPDLVLGQEYYYQFKAIGGKPPLKWSSNFLLPGLSLDPLTGILSGIPVLGNYTLGKAYFSNISVQDSSFPIATTSAVYRLSMKIVLPKNLKSNSLKKKK